MMMMIHTGIVRIQDWAHHLVVCTTVVAAAAAQQVAPTAMPKNATAQTDRLQDV